jgi:uncharacterized protein
MIVRKVGNKYVGRLQKGEEIVQTLTDFCKKNMIRGGWVTAIGATNNCVISYHSLSSHDYVDKEYKGTFEITSIVGNISVVCGLSFLHLHISIADENNQVYGGHLKSAIVNLTCEFVIEDYEFEIIRRFDEETKLNLMNL